MPYSMKAPETCPNHGDLLAILNNPARVTEKDLKNAHRLMKKWFGFSYSVWLENNA